MAETRYVIGNTIIPADGWFNNAYPAISEGFLLEGAEDRHITTCYNLWKTAPCYLRATTWQFPESGWNGSQYYTYYWSCINWSIAGSLIKGAANYSTGGYPSYPTANKNGFQIAYTSKTCYSSSISHTGNGSVQFYLAPKTISVSHRVTGYFGSRTYTSSGSVGGSVSEAAFNSAAPLHFGGEAVEFHATPANDNTRVKHWKINDAIVSNTTGKNVLALSMYSSDMRVECVFEQYKNPITVKSEDEAIGTVSKTLISEYYEVDTLVGDFTASVIDNENYKFIGWYKAYLDNAQASQCNILVSTEETLTITAEDSAVTYYAKFASRKTTLKVDVASSKNDGEGSFDITINNGSMLTEQTSFLNEDARDGWRIVLNAKPKDNYSYFDHWLIPLGNSATDNVYKQSLSFDLLARESNEFTAYFAGKQKKTVALEVSGEGSLYYDYFDGQGSTTSATTLDIYEESEIVFVAEETSKLYAFARWEYAIGSEWATLTNEAKPTWVRSVEGNQVVVYIVNTATPTKLRAAFTKLNTYTISAPVIKGDHPINKTEASSTNSGCSVSDLPKPDEYDPDGTPKWVEGTVFVITATQGPKWDFAQLTVVQPEETIEETKSQSVTVTLKGNISKIEAVFSAKKYSVTPKVDPDSVAVGKVKMTYKDITNEDVTTDKTADVYVDTPVKIEAYTDFADGSVAFHAWSLNNVATNYGATADVTIVGPSEFVASFKAKQAFTFEGYATENEQSYGLGEISIAYLEDGYVKTETLPQGELNDLSLMLACGSTYTLTATAKAVTTESGASLQGYFNGWTQQNAEGFWIPVDGWGEVVEAIKVSTPRTLKATFSKENRWPILRLRNIGDTSYASFSVGGARPDRVQNINEKDNIVLTNANDYFCDPYSIVQVRLDKYYEGSKFVKWVQYEFGSVDEPGTTLIGDYSTTQDLSIFMTGNLYLVPVFYTGNPIPATALLSPKVDATWGDVSIEGEALETVSDSKKSFAQGDKATFVASPFNGYRFVGWSTTGHEDAIESESARYEVTMDLAKTYYAIFKQDRNAIYRFGEAEETKTMVWHSKRVEVNSPINFSVAQVDAEGYGEGGPKLTVFKASSPNLPAKAKTYKIADCNTRRLEAGRGEKAFEFEIVSAVAVNKVNVSTSVSGLLGGT